MWYKYNMMQNQHLQPEEVPANDLNRVYVGSETDLPTSTETGVHTPSGTMDTVEQQPPMEADALLPTQGVEKAEPEALLNELIRQAHKQGRWRRFAVGFYYAGIFSYILYSMLRLSGWNSALPSAFALLLVLLYASALVTEIVTRLRWNRSTAKITNIDDVRAVGALAEAMEIPDKGMLAQAQKALTRLLQRLEVGDAHLLNETQRKCLYRRLKIEYALHTPDFMVALLEALEKIGDAGALPAVQELATCTVTTASGKRVQAAARKCLPVLRLRVRTLETSSTLLRASSAEDTGGASLLRPVHGGDNTAPEELLRAARSDEEG
jgi:hypothetical protein